MTKRQNAKMSKRQNIKMPECQNAKKPKCQNVKIPKCQNAKLPNKHTFRLHVPRHETESQTMFVWYSGDVSKCSHSEASTLNLLNMSVDDVPQGRAELVARATKCNLFQGIKLHATYSTKRHATSRKLF